MNKIGEKKIGKWREPDRQTGRQTSMKRDSRSQSQRHRKKQTHRQTYAEKRQKNTWRMFAVSTQFRFSCTLVMVLR